MDVFIKFLLSPVLFGPSEGGQFRLNSKKIIKSMKKLNIFLVLMLLLGFSCKSQAQTVDEIIKKHVEAIGGMDSLNAIKTLKMTGKFNGGGFEVPSTMTYKRSDKVRMDMTFQGNSMIQAYDGAVAWQTNPFSGKPDPEKMPAERTKDMREMADFDGTLVNYKQKGYAAELMGKEDMEGSEVYKIKLTDKDGDVKYSYLDAQSFLLLKESQKRKVKEKEIESETYYGNYQKFGGVMMALSFEFRQKGEQQGQTATIETVEINPTVDDTIFTMPKGK